MPRMNGFAVVQAIGPERMPAVIFVTAHDQYAIRAFEFAALDYLLKPVTEERFALAFGRASARVRMQPQDETARQVVAMLDAIASPPRRLTRFAVRSGERTIFVPVDDVDRIEAFQNYVRLYVGETTHLLHVPMNTIEAVLDPDRFLRIHRSHIVNLHSVREIQPWFSGEYIVLMKDAAKLKLSRNYRERFEEHGML